MIDFIKYKLQNGLTVILHRDESTPLVAVDILYKVGSKDEDPNKTGFAHLFEHLMFGGTENVPDFDIPIQQAGGDNNAFTNKDITNFYNILPHQNLETALWLESDRMEKLNINAKSLDVQKKVVVEEFKETSINQPYGDLWHVLSDTAFKEHPYRWPTIGLKTEHISEANLEDVESFFDKHYHPSNAILVIAGQIIPDEVKPLVEKWFGNIAHGKSNAAPIPREPAQEKFRSKTIQAPVPSNAIYLAFHMPERMHEDFAAFDVLSDILSGGRSSRFHQKLLKGSGIFSNLSAYITGTVDPGLFVIEAKLIGENDIDQAKELIWNELVLMKSTTIEPDELEKVKNSLIASINFSEVSIIHKAINLAYYEMLSDADLINKQEEEYETVSVDDIKRIANQIFQKENCSEVIYLKD